MLYSIVANAVWHNLSVHRLNYLEQFRKTTGLCESLPIASIAAGKLDYYVLLDELLLVWRLQRLW